MENKHRIVDIQSSIGGLEDRYKAAMFVIHIRLGAHLSSYFRQVMGGLLLALWW